ncbi:JmjC domain-containing protein [Streptomyces seoulensis]
MTFAALDDWTGDTSAFLAHHWRKAPHVYRTSPVPPITLEDIDAAVRNPLLRTPYVVMVKDGNTLADAHYTATRTVDGTVLPGFADPSAIVERVREGCTLLLRNAEHWHPGIAALAHRWQAALGRAVEGFVFVTPPGSQGLAVHRDDADVLLLQISGSKQWAIHDGPSGEKWKPGAVPDPGPPLLRRSITRGDVLYIPRGFAHSALGGDQGLSVHLSMTVREVNVQDLYTALQRLMLSEFSSSGRPLDDAALLDHTGRLMRQMRSSLDGLDPQDVLSAARRARLRPDALPPSQGLAALAKEIGPPS